MVYLLKTCKIVSIPIGIILLIYALIYIIGFTKIYILVKTREWLMKMLPLYWY